MVKSLNQLTIKLSVNGKYVVDAYGDGDLGSSHDLLSFDSLQEVFEFADKLFPDGD